jgi:hypothetical protein
MPSVSEPQRRFMEMCSTPEGRAKAEGKCPPAKVAQDFRAADHAKAHARKKAADASTARSYGFH